MPPETLPSDLEKRLADSDLFLFTSGGCHVFARELLDILPDESYALKQVVRVDSTETRKCQHVFLQAEEYGVDALGIHRIDDLVATYYTKPWHKTEWSYLVEAVSLDECFEPDPKRSNGDSGPLNKWGLFLHEKFVEKVAERARKVILACKERYSVSVFKLGQKRANDKHRSCRD